MMQKNQLWIGRLLPYMTDTFIMTAFSKMSLPRPLSVKLLRKKFTGEFAGYGFIHFQTNEELVEAMYTLNGRPIPDSMPITYFYLNNVFEKGEYLQGKYFAVWVGNLSADVNDHALNRTFSEIYNIATAKVVYDASGKSKGYGILKFVLELEQRDALINMNGYTGLGTKPLHVFSAVVKPKNHVEKNNTKNFHNDMGLSDYYDPSEYLKRISEGNRQNDQHNTQTQQQNSVSVSRPTTKSTPAQNGDKELVCYKRPFDIDIANTEFLNPDLSLWDSLEYSQWFPYDDV